MAVAGQVIEGTTSSIEFVETTADSGGERVVVEITYAPSSAKPPAHFHPSQTERFHVLEGEIHVIVAGEELVLTAGDDLEVPPGTIHEMWSKTGAKQRWETTPALRTERFFETVWGLQAAGKAGRDGIPSKPQMALTLRRFADEFRLADPPAPVQAVAFPLLGLIGRVQGLEAEYRPGDEAPQH